MANDDWYSQDEINARAKEQEREDFHDLQDEIAGRDTGKMARFTSEEDRAERGGQEPDSKKQSHTDLSLQILMEDAAYRSAYDDTLRALQEAEHSAQAAIDETQNQLFTNDRELTEIQSRASTLPDGTRVYRDKDGNVFDEDGAQIDASEAEAVIWRDDNPSFEQYQGNRERDVALQDRITNLYDYQVNTLGYIRGRMTDTDDPITSTHELANVRDEIQNQQEALLGTKNEAAASNEKSFGSSMNIDLPTLS